MGARRFVIRGYAVATLHAYAEEGILTDEDRQDEESMDLAAAVDAYVAGGPYTTSEQPRAVVVTPENAEAVRRGLVDLANIEDDIGDDWRHGRTRDPELARMSRQACVGLSGLAQRVARYQHGLTRAG